MSLFTCTHDNVTDATFYKAGEIYDLPANPNTRFFTALSDNDAPRVKRPAGFAVDSAQKTLFLPGMGWEDLRYPATGINPPGNVSSDPTRNTTTGLLEFSASTENIIAGVAQMPHCWKEGSAISPHIHWYGANASAKDVVWKLGYKLLPVVGAIPSTFTYTTITARNTGEMQIDDFDFIDMTGYKVSTMIQWVLHRMAAASADDFNGVANLVEFDIHYLIDSVGSGEETKK